MNEDYHKELPIAMLSKKYEYKLDSFCTKERKEFAHDSGGHFTNVTRRVTDAAGVSAAMNEDFHRDLPIIMLRKKYEHVLDDQVRDAIYNMYCFCTKEAKQFAHVNEGYFTNITRRVTEATGVSAEYVNNLVNEYNDIGPEVFLKPILRYQKNAFYNLNKKIKTSKIKNEQTCSKLQTNTEKTLNTQCENCDIIIPDLLEQSVSEDKNKNEPFQINSYTHDYDKNIDQETVKNMTDLESASELRKFEDFDTDLPIIKLNEKYAYRLNYHVRVLVYRVCCYFDKEFTEYAHIERGYFTVFKRVAIATGVSTAFTLNLIDEYRSIGPQAFLTPTSRNRHRASKRLKKKAALSTRLKKEEEASIKLKMEQEALTKLKKKEASRRRKKKANALKRLKKKAELSKKLKKKAKVSTKLKKKANASKSLKKKAEPSKRLKKNVDASPNNMQQTYNPTFLNFEMKTGETLNMKYEKIDDIDNDDNVENVLGVQIKSEIDILENEPFSTHSYYLNTNMCQHIPDNITELNSTSIKMETKYDTSTNFEVTPAAYDSRSVKLEPTTAVKQSDIVAPDISIKKEVSNPY